MFISLQNYEDMRFGIEFIVARLGLYIIVCVRYLTWEIGKLIFFILVIHGIMYFLSLFLSLALQHWTVAEVGLT